MVVADEIQCNGSDVFGSDICTCRPYREWSRAIPQKHPLYFGDGVSGTGSTASKCIVRLAGSTDLAKITVVFGIEEAVKEAQNGGSGVVIYFRKEGRALGEVTKVRTL